MALMLNSTPRVEVSRRMSRNVASCAAIVIGKRSEMMMSNLFMSNAFRSIGRKYMKHPSTVRLKPFFLF